MHLKDSDRRVLEVVALSDGRWDTRNLDHAYYSRSTILLEPHILGVLRGLELRGLVEPVNIDGGTGPGWRLTRVGRQALAQA